LQKIAIIVRSETLDKCTGKGCLKAFFQRLDSFSHYDQDCQLIGFTQETGDLEKKINKLKESGVNTVHLSSCLRGKSADYEALAQRLSEDFAVIGYTHGKLRGRTREAIVLLKQDTEVLEYEQ
jgi:predicted metal-binding protein